MSRAVLQFDVIGQPAPQGSKQHVGHGVMVESSKKVKPWRQDVAAAAVEAAAGSPISDAWTPPTGSAIVTLTFYLPRPKGHYGTGRNAATLRPSAPAYPAVKPDVDKLQRSTLDALTTAGVLRDDAQVIDIRAVKRYADGRPAGASVRVEVSA